MANRYLPICLSLAERPALVVGGGDVARRKIENLMDYEVQITVVSPEAHEKVAFFAEKGKVTWHRRTYESPEAEKFGLVISACNDANVNQQVYHDAKKAGVPVNVVDNPPLCDFIFPATLKRDAITISVSSDGKAPFLSGHLRMVMEDLFPSKWKEISRAASRFRVLVKERYAGDEPRKVACFNRFLYADWNEILKSKESDAVDQALATFLAED